MDTMQNMAVNCSWADVQLGSDPLLVPLLPVELLSLIRRATGSQYLDAVASATLLPAGTDRLSAYYRNLLPEISARWLLRVNVSPFEDHVLVLSSLAKVLPFAPYLMPRVKDLMTRSQGLSSFASLDTNLSGLDDKQLHIILLAFFRLFTYDLPYFKSFVHSALLLPLFKHRSLPLRYLAIQCFSQIVGLADALTGKLISKHVGSQPIPGIWEDIMIDFRLLKIVEEWRWKQQDDILSSFDQQSAISLAEQTRAVTASDLLPETANLAGVLIPRFSAGLSARSTFVYTPTTIRCLREVGLALLRTKSILLKGEPGSGKTSLILEAARELNKSSSLITLHLNEQTDAKTLLGLYTSSEETGSFVWQAGVLTRAILEGRWILIEDIDKAPADVLGVIRPILQNDELYLPSRKQTLRAADGFRIFATLRTNGKSPNSSFNRNSWILNDENWFTINVTVPNTLEVHNIISTTYPLLAHISPSMMSVHQRVELEYQTNHALRSTTARSPSLRDLLKWCRRTMTRLETSDATHGTYISEAIKLDTFKDAVDCYAGHLAAEDSWLSLADLIAEQMHIAPQQAHHCLKTELPSILDTRVKIQIGRAILKKSLSASRKPKQLNPFAFTRQACMTMEKIAAATSRSEPVLLVGETGVGKTTLVQYIASLLGQSLTVANLSQQSEASDLLGGLKPVTTRSLMMPVIDEFSSLFDETFSAKKNEKFLSSIQRYVSHENWQRVLLLWQQAIQMADASLQITPSEDKGVSVTRTAKRRKLDTPKYQRLRDRWAGFSQSIDKLRMQVDRAERHLTFAYVEGRIVEAVRHGGWLLLDEINLASSDTLDSIASLLTDTDQERPYLHLTEAGAVERVVAHPEFRVFAAMNPATDTGKKDLTPGIRSRFTEIYVCAGDGDIHDLVNLVETYLGSLLDSDKRAAFDLAKLYLAVKSLNQEHRIVDGAGDDPHFTIRSLVRCLQYVQKHAATYGLRRAIFEGTIMSFCTMLGRESERMVLLLIDQHILSRVKNVRALHAQTPRAPSDGINYISFNHHLVMKGSKDATAQPHYIRTPSVERNLLNLARAASMHRFPVLLQGPTSSGKTSMVEYLARSTGNHFVRVNNHEHTDLQEYLGSYASNNDGRLEFQEGVLVQALRHGHWIVLDELNLAPSDVLEALNRLLDDNRELLIPETQEVVRPHPKFMLFATQNPAGLYGGRKRLSRAFRNRFLELHFDDIPEDELEVILQKRAQIAPSFCTQIVAVYKRLSLQRQSSRLFEQQNSFATLRDLFRWASRPMDDRTQLATQGFMLLGERVRDPVERQIVKDIIEEVIRVKIDLSTLYNRDKIPASVSDDSIIWTPGMRRLFVLVSVALKNNEPVLLVGETGCGKTQICQTIAHAFQHYLNVYNAHSSTETGDLIGSQRPARHRSEADDLLKRQLLDLLGASTDVSLEGEPLEILLDRFSQMDVSTIEEQNLADVRANIARHKSLFEWADGSLVRAMKEGQFFLLDEISLAEDSVLERLNSLLEPSRTILLAEKGPADNVVVAAPGFQFLSTMNPGGDYGKRELSAALRNRLTEIWVPPLAEAIDALPILESKLRVDLQFYAKAMLQFSGWFRITFLGASAEALSLRDLIAWAEFLQQNSEPEANTTFFHGAAMVFIDSLGANPAGVMSSVNTNVTEARALCIEKLNELTKTCLPSIYDQELTLNLTEHYLKAGHFQIERSANSVNSVEIVFEAPTTLKNTMRLVRALQMPRPILLEGSPGVGKTAIVTALAQVLGKQLDRINLSDQTDLMDLFGADIPMENEDVGKFVWSDGPLLKAMQAGGWVLLDEMNLASQSVLEGLNSCLDHRQEVFIAELDRTFACHSEFRLFAAQNPHHQGGGRKGLPKSFVNRFTVVYADPLEKADLYQVCGAKFPGIQIAQIKAVVDMVSEIQDTIGSNQRFGVGGPWEFNLRDASRWLQMLEQTPSLSPDHYFSTLILQRLRSPYQKELARNLSSRPRGTDEQASLYNGLSPEVFQVGTAFLHRDLIWQKSINGRSVPTSSLPYAQSIIEAVNCKWPVVLVEPAQRSSTMLIRQLAAATGAAMTKISLNSDTDTMDLIGGLEQHDPHQDVMAMRAVLQLSLEKVLAVALVGDDFGHLSALLGLHSILQDPETSLQDLKACLRGFSTLTDAFVPVLNEVEQLFGLQRSDKVGFVWSDGVLIDALKEGQWLVLENANTCNPAVLDRLNSLLEPNGVLIMNEQHNSAGSPRIVKPHPNFRIFLTMDPRHGELSRAMRNRSLELYIDEVVVDQSESTALTYPYSADLYRIRQLRNSTTTDADFVMQSLLMDTWMDHISDHDRDVLESPHATNSLFLSNTNLLQDRMQGISWLSPTFKSQGKSLQMQLLSYAQMDEVRLLPYLPLIAVNEPLIVLSLEPSMKVRAERYAWARRLLLRSNMILASVDQAKGCAQTLNHKDRNMLQKSLISGTKNENTGLPFAAFLVAACTTLRQVIERDYDTVYDPDMDILRVCENMLAFVIDILVLSRGANIRPGLLLAYMQNGYDIISMRSIKQSAVQAAFSVPLDLFAQRSPLKSGQSLCIMWNELRPLTASTEDQLGDILRLEALLKKLDNLSISPDSLTHVTNAKQQLIEIHRCMLIGKIHQTCTFDEFDIQITQLEAVMGDEVRVVGHFSGIFKSILQISKASKKPLTHDLIASLASTPTLLDVASVTGRPLPVAFTSILQMVSSAAIDKDWNTWRDKFGLALVRKIATSEGQPISTIGRTRIEVTTLLQSLSAISASCNSEVIIHRLHSELRGIVLGILSCHIDLLSEAGRASLASGNIIDTHLGFADTVPANHYFRTIYQDYLHTPLTWSSGTTKPAVLQFSGAAFISIALGSLRLLVPDQPYDPALAYQVAHTRFERRYLEIQNLLKAQRTFETSFTGQQTSLLIRMIEDELHTIGDEPAAAAVVRPSGDGLAILAVEFTNLLRSIVDCHPEKILLAEIPGRWYDRDVSTDTVIGTANKVLQTVEQLLERFGLVDRAFDDLTRPIVWILQCLAIGTQMLAASRSSSILAQQRMQRRADRIPLLSSMPEMIMNIPLALKDTSPGATEDFFGWLEHLAVTVSIEKTSFMGHGTKFDSLLAVTDSMYKMWKANLEKDQDAAVSRSKYYAYRGDEDLDESQEKEAVSQMFPTFENNQQFDQVPTRTSADYDAGTTAVRLAKLQHRLFFANGYNSNLEVYIHTSLEDLSNAAYNENLEIGPVPSQDLMPMILLNLEARLGTLKAPERKERLNVYTDGDIFEAHVLHDLVKSVIKNFRNISEAWPEHAVPVDVLAFCREVLTFSLKDPIAKLLAKTEKLLEIVAQWQAVASREYSAAENIDGITKLIIRWRQLELSSWSRLLDLEEQKVEDRVRSWYFMLYEAIISHPRQVLDQGDDLSAYLKELARTLEDFLTSSSYGEFAYRLQLCQSFEKFLVAMVASNQELRPVFSCLKNMIRHHERYQEGVQSMLMKGRAGLEKKLREQIKLASWKDTNISALRESARRSHFKLFKIVRKYRGLLSQPLQQQKTSSHDEDRVPASSRVDLLSPDIPALAVNSALSIANAVISGWKLRPERLSNPFGAAARMKLLTRRQGDSFIASDELSQFVTSLRSSMKNLRDRTPSLLSEENRNLISHLKVLKQTLFSDTLRYVKHMGVRRDLGGIEMEKMMSRAVVLAAIPSLASKSHPKVCMSAENDFHEALDLMPGVRGALVEHSDQVRVKDVRRGVAYADGLLSMLIDQRQAIAAYENHADTFGAVLEKMRSFALQPIDQFEHTSLEFQARQTQLRSRLCWLPELIAISVKALQVQMKHSAADLAGNIESLLAFSQNIRDQLARLRSLPLLPYKIRFKDEAKQTSIVGDLLEHLRQEIEVAILHHPQSAPILQRLLPWTDLNNTEIMQAVNGYQHLDINVIDISLQECLDTIFEAVQQVSSCSEQMPSSIETNGWLAKSQKRQVDMMESLRLSELTKHLERFEASLSCLVPQDLAGGISLIVASLPILVQYSFICQYIVGQALALHCETAKATVLLIKTLTTIASEGFCNPQEASKGEEQLGQVESGTGLGDGTGADDISKDVGEDEDLSELAQQENERPEGQDLEASKDAVNMDKDEFKGEDGDPEESAGEEDGSSQSGDDEGSDLDEETGSVDNLDPSAVDEKVWKGLDAEKDKELENEKAGGEKSDDQTAKQENQTKGDDEQQQDDTADDGSENSGSEMDEGEGTGRDDIDQVDSNLQEEKPLDLLEEMQLNGDEDGVQDDLSEDSVANLSDVESEGDPTESKSVEPDSADNDEKDAVNEINEQESDDEMCGPEDEEHIGRPDEDEIMEDQSEPDVPDDKHEHITRNDDMSYDVDENQAGEVGDGEALDADDNATDVIRDNAASQKSDQVRDHPQVDAENEENDKGTDEDGGITRGGRSKMDVASPQAEALKKLGDMLEQWHQRREIHQATKDHTDEETNDIDIMDADFEHVQNEEDTGDAEALDAASKEQARALDQTNTLEDDEMRGDTDQAPADVDEEDHPVQESMVERFSQLQTKSETQQDSGPGAIMPERRQESDQNDGVHEQEVSIENDESDKDHVYDLVVTGSQDPMSQAEASHLWSDYSVKVQQISLILTEQLRLILAPTLATKLRGDFRTGKRLDIKRIIPYIASGYKRDKIWMRRSVPSKRNYQIMLALDDSKSMMEGGAGALALETLAMLCKSLSMLEAGDLCVIGFGNEKHVRMAHPFGQPFGNEAGVKIFQNFAFNQTATDVKKMLRESIGLFQDARAKSTGSQSGLWQLQLIISDGICEDHETVSRLVRQAKEEKIMIVFVIVDGSGDSILDLKQASFEADETGEMKLSTRRYLEKFPFPYYLVVRDVRDLPAVLATALKGWFAQVVDV